MKAEVRNQVSEVSGRLRMSADEWRAEGARRFGPNVRDWKFVCPICKTVQGVPDFYKAGFEPGKGEVNKYLAFSCIGRFTNAGPWQGGAPGRGCDWTLGGLFQVHSLVVIDEEGVEHPRFEFAEEAEK